MPLLMSLWDTMNFPAHSFQVGNERRLAPATLLVWGTAKGNKMAEWDSGTKETVKKIPLLGTKAGPRDKDVWETRLKEELRAIISYIKLNKDSDSDWFKITSNKEGTHWSGQCWYVHDLQRYEFDFEFDIPATYPATAPEIRIPELEGKTAKMYRGGAICLTVHFKPLWAKNSPRFGIAHALCLGLAPWMAAEIPYMVDGGIIHPKT